MSGIKVLGITRREERGAAPIVTYITGGPLGEHAFLFDIHTDGGYADAVMESVGFEPSNSTTEITVHVENRPGYKDRGSGGMTEIRLALPSVPDVNGEKALWVCNYQTNRYGLRIVCINEAGAPQEWLWEDEPVAPEAAQGA